ncbi:NADPH:quinone oxidoreductase family protein [Sphingomonas panacisoli]|uniref:NADPH:quinone oxidoreductase family protein n=1 Tax=Sphingomonas panacisoli TaxID=1813879 RepID=A0A5B8LEU7_9SPHN|nr:NADPH:quinone oxidoreductase family protein [Sphingomonas panacisoli]QDZ06242.1 NADPH:quinone oxidoreductase family protein [Sphingomonas panacisoli]
MKALVVSSLAPDFAGCALADVSDPMRRPGQVLVRVRAASLNFPDLLMTEGKYQLKPDLPFVPGMEVAGEVVEADADSGFSEGVAVVAGTRLGGFAELVTVDARSVRAKPANLDFAHAASVGAAYNTAYVSLVRLADVQPGEWVVVHGATGGVGLAAVDLAKALGARVIATSRSAEKLAVIADEYATDATLTAPGFREAVKELTGGGADVIYDPVGGDVFDESTRCIAFGGRLLVVGFTSGRIATVATNIPLIKGFSVIGVRAGEYGRRFPDKGRENQDAIWTLASAGKIHPRVDARYPLADWRTAFEAMRDSRMVGKIVIEP